MDHPCITINIRLLSSDEGVPQAPEPPRAVTRPRLQLPPEVPRRALARSGVEDQTDPSATDDSLSSDRGRW
jgi:hypothetical protein